ncbi:uncharacterized protein C15orf41 homolog [Copidosoma floridanum]|uniref:uncharacterized protein C15orf41 homolog n=1 Tax=Copidosoma floridanum TaxID=29053 RepID=UPI0006C94789|nr:uncharacterized protein C15orf41 homolog [Copidosoma floridanum]
MKDEEYKKIVKTIQNYRGLSRECANMLLAKYKSFPPTTLYGILSQEIKKKMTMLHWKVFGKGTNFYGNYLEAAKKQEQSSNKSSILLKTAIKHDVCPSLLARKVLEEYCNLKDSKITKQDISKMMRDTTLIEDKDLAYDIYMCILYDDQYGPISSAIDESVGEEYEMKLEIHLKEHNIPFYNENHLRSKGYDKTPDFKLEIPIAVNGFVVNWIESKGQFGSPKNHQTYIKEQFSSYWNRFGPGLVIYWFGYVDSIVQASETKFIIMDHFPTNIQYMNPSSLRS